jgi:hypothetical protein
MAEAFKKLFDSTLNQSNLNDGEHTLLSGGNNKVIKSISVTSPDIALKDTYLELDGVNIGGVKVGAGGSVTLEGHQILAPTSVLKLKTNDFPIVAEKVIGVCNDGTKLRYYSYIEDSAGNAVNTSDSSLQFQWESNETVGSLSYSSQIIDLYKPGPSQGGTNNIHYIAHDDNSVQVFHATRALETGGTLGYSPANNYQMTYQNYKTFGFRDFRKEVSASGSSRSASYDRFFSMDGSTFQQHQPYIYPQTYSVTTHTASPWWTSGSHPSPHPTSSYPRGGVYHDMYCYMPSSGYSGSIYIKNTITGAFYEAHLPAALQFTHGSFVLAVDHSNDAWYIYYHNGANNLTQVKGPWSWSEMLGSTGSAAPSAVNTRKQIASSDWAEHNNITALGLYQNFHGGQLGYTATGGVRYRDTNNVMYTLDATGNLKYSYTEDPQFGNKGGSSGYLWRHYGHPIPTSVASAAGLTNADVKVTITGIEQT